MAARAYRMGIASPADTAGADRALIAEIRAALRRRADPLKAPAMRAYMKSEMPYLGVQSTPLREACREVFSPVALGTQDELAATALALWREAEFREERYAAIALTGEKRYRGLQTPALIPVYEEMIVTGAWWDYVDAVAIHRVGPILLTHRATVTETMLRWSRDPSLWRRRTAIICQVGAKEQIDTELLVSAIEPNLADREFFIRKAIGWALREYAKREPQWVDGFLRAHDGQFSGLSRREAERGIEMGRRRASIM